MREIIVIVSNGLKKKKTRERLMLKRPKQPYESLDQIKRMYHLLQSYVHS